MSEKIAGEKILEMRCLLEEKNERGEQLLTQFEHEFLEKMAILTEDVFEATGGLYPDITWRQKELIDNLYEKYDDYLESDD